MKRVLNIFTIISLFSLILISCDKNEGGEIIVPSELSIVNAPDSARFQAGQTLSWDLLNVSQVSDIQVSSPIGWQSEILVEKLYITAPDAHSEEYDIKGDVTITYKRSDAASSSISLPVVVNIEPEGPQDGISFELVYSEVTSTSAILDVTPSRDDFRYYYDLCTMEDYNEIDGDVGIIVKDVLDNILTHYPDFTMEQVLSAMLSQGHDRDTVYGLPAATDMCFFAIAVDDSGEIASEPSVTYFTTLEGGDPADCTFDMEVSQIRGTSVFISITPSDPSVRYWYAVTPREGYPGDIPMMAEVKAEAANYASEVGMSLEEVIAGVTVAGPIAEYWWDLSLDTEYYLYAFAMDEQGNSLGDMYKVPFNTAVEDISDAEVEVEYRYFDGDELYQYDPVGYANAQGKVVVQVKATPNYYATDWAVALAAGDYTDETIFPYDATINAILSAGAAQYNKTISQFYANWSDCTILAFAADYSGYNGPLTRILLQPTKDGAADISELAPIEQSIMPSMSENEFVSVKNGISFENRFTDVRVGRNF